MDAVLHGLHAGRCGGIRDTARHPWRSAAPHDRRSPRAGSSPSPRPRTGPWPADPSIRPLLRQSARCPGRPAGARARRTRCLPGRRGPSTGRRPGPRRRVSRQISQARDQVRLMGRRGGGEVDVHAVLHRFGFRDSKDVDAQGDGVGIVEALGFDVGRTGFVADDLPAKRLRPEPAERGVIPGIYRNLNKPSRHTADPKHVCTPYGRRPADRRTGQTRGTRRPLSSGATALRPGRAKDGW